MLFYSGANTCNEKADSLVLYNLMFVLLIVGYFQMLVYGLLLCCLPCILYILLTQGPRPALSG